ncbi:MAG: hypothetical protein LBN12_01425 [Clostridiales Family XIII bacterium]|jgi:ABC-type multidrug transport system ATPase subunit|nr:hypothetical protein [Clostridiales Family XIII bacterium]
MKNSNQLSGLAIEADQLADRIAVIDHGRVIAEDPPDNLKISLQKSTLDEVFLTLTGE